MRDQISDLRPTLRTLLAALLGGQLFWFYLVGVGVTADRVALVYVAVALTLFFSLHRRLINSFGFYTELADFADRGQPQNVMVFGEWVEKRKDLKITRDKSWLTQAPYLSGSAIAYWVVIFYLSFHLIGSFSIQLFAVGTLACWAWASTRAFMWIPISCITYFLSLWQSHSNFTRLMSTGAFFLVLTAYSLSYYFYSARTENIHFNTWFKSFLKPMAIFTIVFFISLFFFPDEKTEMRKLQLKADIADRMAKFAQNKNRQQSVVNGGRRGGKGQTTSHAGGSGGSGSGGSGGAAGAGGAGDMKSADSATQAVAQNSATGKPSGDNSKTESGQSGQSGPMSPPKQAGQNSNSNLKNSAAGDSSGAQQKSANAPLAQSRQGDSSNGGSNKVGSTDASAESDSNLTGGSASAANSNDDVPDDIESKPSFSEPKIKANLDWIERLLKLAIVAALIFAIYKFLFGSAKKDKKSESKAERQRQKNILKEISKLHAKSFASRQEEIIETYKTYLHTMDVIGMKRMNWQTPDQFCNEVSKLSVSHSAISQSITKGFTSTFYGEENISDQDLENLRKCSRRLKYLVS